MRPGKYCKKKVKLAGIIVFETRRSGKFFNKLDSHDLLKEKSQDSDLPVVARLDFVTV